MGIVGATKYYGPVQALKGAALHRDGLYRADERPMADLDLLVLPQHTEAEIGRASCRERV